MRLIGQRWEYRLGNSTVHVDNAFSWLGWSQERLVVNEEPVQSSNGWWRLRQNFKEPWLTRVGEEELSVLLRSRIRGIDCVALLGGEILSADRLLECSWSGPAKSWPGEAEWKDVVPGTGWAIS